MFGFPNIVNFKPGDMYIHSFNLKKSTDAKN